MKKSACTLRFFEMLLALLKGNTSLIDSLHVLASGGIEKPVRNTAERLLQIMKKGLSFSDSLNTLRDGKVRVESLYINLIKAAEMTGTIEAVLERILEDLKRKQQSREAAAGIMVYPAIIIAAACIGTMVIIFKGIPLFTEAGFLSGAVLDSAKAGIFYAGMFLLVSGGVLFMVYYYIFGRDSAEFRIFYLLSFLLQGNISVHDALFQCIAGAGESKPGKALVLIRKELASGTRISQAFARSAAFSPYISGWLAIAEKSGNFGEACRNIAVYYQNRDTRRRFIASKCIEPAVIIVTGIYLLLLIQSAILPILTHAGGLL
jgi:type IV pilus assembly protein PilC